MGNFEEAPQTEDVAVVTPGDQTGLTKPETVPNTIGIEDIGEFVEKQGELDKERGMKNDAPHLQ